MIENLGGVTSQLVSLALDAALLRHQVTAHNIANADTPGFSAGRVNFDDLLARFSTAALDPASDAALRGEIDALRRRLADGDAAVARDGGPVELDREMIALTENVLRYRALLEANSKRGELLKMAISEGRS